MFDLPVQNDGVNLRPMVGAIIYIRVSTKEQTENLSLPTQLRVCEEYCRREGFEILERFKEEGESAKTADRTELQRLLAYCRSNKGKVHFLVVFNLTRFPRDKYDHFALRSHLKSLGISLRSATEPIDDTSTGKLMEGVLAAFAQFDNDVRSDRTRAGMQEALRRGRWTLLGPLGYLNAPRAMRQSLIPDPERAAIVRRVFKQYATGTYTKQEILRKATEWRLTNRRGHPLSSQAIAMLLRNRLYVGIIDVSEFGVRDQRGARGVPSFAVRVDFSGCSPAAFCVERSETSEALITAGGVARTRHLIRISSSARTSALAIHPRTCE